MVRSSFDLNNSPHIMHLCVLFPVWLSRCREKLRRDEKHATHFLHLYRFFVSCVGFLCGVADVLGRLMPLPGMNFVNQNLCQPRPCATVTSRLRMGGRDCTAIILFSYDELSEFRKFMKMKSSPSFVASRGYSFVQTCCVFLSES